MDRRRFLEHGLVASGVLASRSRSGKVAARSVQGRRPAAVGPGREELLFDFGWRFAFGHTQDPARDFNFGRGDEFKQAGAVMQSTDYPGFKFDDSKWRQLDLPHDWAV